MIKTLRLWFMILPVLGSVPTGLRAADAQPPTVPLMVMTYNVRYAGDPGSNAWPARLPLLVNVIRREEPDVMGTQEGLYTQLKDLAAGLPRYDWIGLGRDGGSRGEFMAIFYKKDRFEPLEFDHFWLSDTPDVVASASWDHSNRRMVTWVRFLDRTTGREFYSVNTHLDHAVQLAREKGAALIAQRVKLLRADLPVVLTGDFNAVANNNKAYDTLVPDPFQDTWMLARERRGEDLNTFNGFKSVIREGQRIDWILVRGTAEVSRVAIFEDAEAGRFPSDHFPMAAWIRFGSPASPGE
jgi:endonuclease/exonuclease/phosphatase family metal-dependent hydrolase